MSNWHRIRKFLHHRSKARQRHGIHSPFVYEFSAQFLKGKIKTGNLCLTTSRHKKAVNKIITYFAFQNILWLANRHGEQETFITISPASEKEMALRAQKIDAQTVQQFPQPDLLLIDLIDPGDWMPAFKKYQQRLTEQSVVLIIAPHHTPQHTAAWQQIHAMPEVKLSLDLYKTGLLFFRKEFLEKQHFLLKH